MIVVTGDRDTFQLVEDPFVRVMYTRRGVSDNALYDEAGIEERNGVRPEKYPVLAALRGDTSDNLPGVPGVGEKTAAKLVSEYGDLDTIFAHLDELDAEAPPEPGRPRGPGAAERRGDPAGPRRAPRRATRRPALGGWDADEVKRGLRRARAALRCGQRFAALMSEGDVGEAAAPVTRADAPGVAGAVAWPAATPEWLADAEAGRAHAPSAAASKALEALLAACARAPATWRSPPAWTGDPGRSPR